ncbi:MAG: hypothetical protein CL899_01615 [Dehalococcoidia bacterium]|nr:hypothetical protein [Dehalococcoidia bacterium]|tara:strand:- start:309 stop:1061 length:753 start_codon:yes stop_codon:yes gene_type:complete
MMNKIKKYLNPIPVFKFIFIKSTYKTEERERLITKIVSITEAPLIILAFAMIPLLIGPYIWDLSEEEVTTFNKLDNLVWSIFVINLVVKLIIAPRRLSFVKSNFLEVIVVMPYLQPLRIVFFGSKAIWGMTKISRVELLTVLSGGLVITAATLITSLERARNPDLGSFPDALWWAIVTITTVGYGNQEPVTFFGRIVAIVLMITGVGFFGAVAANLAAFFVKKDEVSQVDKFGKEISEINKKLDRLIKKK